MGCWGKEEQREGGGAQEVGLDTCVAGLWGTTEGGTCEVPAWKREYGIPGGLRGRRAFWQFPFFFSFLKIKKFKKKWLLFVSLVC